jgi:CHAT domain-containing protein
LGGLRGFYVGGLKRIRPALGATKAKGVKLEDPLVRSGLALAGANRALKGGGGRGLLTAGKVLGLPLWGTELVVLSACDTGRGEVKRGEGVFGLRRCILQAGAQSLVMSLWRVSDRESRELMAAFYRNVLQGMDRCRALRKAALAEMAAVEKRHGTTHPFFWSAFVFLGDPGRNNVGVIAKESVGAVEEMRSPRD